MRRFWPSAAGGSRGSGEKGRIDAETQACSEHCTYLAIGGHVAVLEIEAEAEAMALEEELSRSTPPGGVAALAATPAAPLDGDLEAAT